MNLAPLSKRFNFEGIIPPERSAVNGQNWKYWKFCASCREKPEKKTLRLWEGHGSVEADAERKEVFRAEF